MIHCNAEWHLRENPRAYLIYTIALRIARGTGRFFVSQPQLAEFFDWDVKTVRIAFKALRASGLFALLRGGRGGDGQAGFANVYSVTTHSKLSKGKHPCRPLPESGTLVYKATEKEQRNPWHPLPESGMGGLPETGILVSEQSTNIYSEATASGIQPPATPKKKFSYFQDDFSPKDNHRREASELGVNLDNSLAAFKLHHKSRGSRMADWDAAFSGWLLNAVNFIRQKPYGPKGSPPSPVTTGSLTQNYNEQIARYK